MKKLKIVGLISIMLIFGMMSLGSGSSSGDKKEIVSSDVKEDSDEKEDVDKANDSTEENDSDEEASNDNEKVDVTSQTTIEEQVLIDDDGLKITAVSYETDSIWGDGIKLLLENERAEDISVGCRALIVNDYMITDLFASTIASGKKAYETLYLSNSELKAAGIDNVGQVEIYFYEHNADTYTDTNDYDCVTIQTSEYENMDIAANDEGHELYNDGEIKIVGKYVDEDSFWGAAVLLYVENNSDKNIIVQCDDMSINGFMITPYFSSTVYKNKKAIDHITLLSSQLEENNITTIDDVELKFVIMDEKYKRFVETDPISFSTK